MFKKILKEDIEKNGTNDEMLDLLKKDGVFLVDNYITGDDLKKLHDETLNLCKTKGGHYEFGRNYRGPSLNNFKKGSPVENVFNESWMRKLDETYRNKTSGFGRSVYATYDYKNNEGLARNGWLHFDRNHCLKFFIYLTDIDKTNGAFSCSIGSRSKGEELRVKAWKKTKNYNGVLNRLELNYPDLLGEYPATPVEAKSGTLIVFDTDTFHKGGECEEGKNRLIIRLHCV